MRTYTVTKREGTYLGPIDWTFNFRKRFNYLGAPVDAQDFSCECSKKLLKQVEENYSLGKEQKVLVSGYWHTVYQVGMYDGWPFWVPYPHVLLGDQPLGGCEWEPWYNIDAVENIL